MPATPGRRGWEWFVARRYLWSRPRKSFIGLISIIAVLGVIVGVWEIRPLQSPGRPGASPCSK